MPEETLLEREALHRCPLQWNEITFWQEDDGSLEVYAPPGVGLWWRIELPQGIDEASADCEPWRIRAYEYGSNEPRADLTDYAAAEHRLDAVACVALMIREQQDPRSLKPRATSILRKRWQALTRHAPAWAHANI